MGSRNRSQPTTSLKPNSSLTTYLAAVCLWAGGSPSLSLGVNEVS